MKFKLFILLGILSLLCINMVFAGTYPPSNSNTIAYYHFNNDSSVYEDYFTSSVIYDYSGRNNATATNIIYNPSSSYLNDGSVNFNGSTGVYINVSDIFRYNNSVCAWIKPTGKDGVIFDFNNTAGFTIPGFKAGSNKFLLQITTQSYLYSSIPFINNTWVYVCFVVSNNITNSHIYINGNISDGERYDVNLGRDINNLQISSRDTGYAFNGSIDDVLVLNKSITAKDAWNNYYSYYGCLNKTDVYIYGDTTLCTNNYYTNGTNFYGIGNYIYYMQNQSSLDCNGSNFYGNFPLDSSDTTTNKSNGIVIDHFSDVTIKNCNLYNYQMPINIFRADNITIENVDTYQFSRIPIERSNYITIKNGYYNNATYDYGMFYITNNNTFLNFTNNSLINANISHIYADGQINDSYFDSNLFDTSSWSNNVLLLTNHYRNVFRNNNFTNCHGYCYADIYGQHNQLINNKFNNFLTYDLEHGVNNTINGGSQNNYNGTYGYSIYLIDQNYSNIFNFNISNDNSVASIAIIKDNWINISGNYIYNNKKYDSIYVTNTSHLWILNNTIDLADKGIAIQQNVNDFYIIGNTLNNSILNYDGYNFPIDIEYNVTNGVVRYNYIDNYGCVGINIRQANNVTVNDNYLDHISISDNLALSSPAKCFLEPDSAIFISQLYKSFTGLGCFASMNISIAQLYTSTNINISNNSYGSNTQVKLRNQGGVNVTHDLTDYTYRKYQYPNTWVDADELYIKNPFTNLSNINYTNINYQLGQDYDYGYNLVATWGMNSVYSYFANPNIIKDPNPLRDGCGNTKTTPFPALGTSYGLSLYNLTNPLIVYSNGTGKYYIGTNLQQNYTIAPYQKLYIYTNTTNVVFVNYQYSYNSADQNGFEGGTEFISQGIIGMVINFFALTPVIGTILGICVLIAGIVIIVVYIRKFSNKSDSFEG